jgi:glycerophosphoryl diester phosphodiesterase
MIEIKKLEAPHTPRQLAALTSQLKALEPGRDFHFLGLEPEVLSSLTFVPPLSLVLVGQINFRAMSRAALKLGFGGYAGPYALITEAMIEAHHLAGQKVGTGFIHSRNVLRRELNRGVDWIFTNHSAQVTALLRGELE